MTPTRRYIEGIEAIQKKIKKTVSHAMRKNGGARTTHLVQHETGHHRHEPDGTHQHRDAVGRERFGVAVVNQDGSPEGKDVAQTHLARRRRSRPKQKHRQHTSKHGDVRVFHRFCAVGGVETRSPRPAFLVDSHVNRRVARSEGLEGQ